ncbi:MAG: branched-chain amino acid ABC transporter permease [Candidatus Heimdallarchaeota archaeon]
MRPIISSYLRMFYKAFKGEILPLPSRFIAILFGIFLFMFPLLLDPYITPFILLVLTYANIFVIFAVSWDLLSGYTGYVSFGHAAFFGVAGYTSAFLNKIGFSPWVTIPIGAIIAVVIGLLIGVPCLRLRGPYLALATLAFPIILTGILFVFPDQPPRGLGGEWGISGLSPLFSGELEIIRRYNYYFSLLLMIGTTFVMWKISDSKIGIILHAIREDEIAARTCGINTTFYKLLAFSISGFFAGIAGGYYAHLLRVANRDMLSVFMSFQPIIWTVFGGITTIYGAIGGAYLLYSLPELLHLAAMKYLFIAGVTVFVLLFMPEGIFNWIRDKIEKECPRCKERNIATRELCRVCDAVLD